MKQAERIKGRKGRKGSTNEGRKNKKFCEEIIVYFALI
jgi:hypothetical protein